MKVKSLNSISKTAPKAARVFTDREEPRAAFWKKYNTVKAELESESSVNVLYYYGIGGIGKSRLLKQLIKELESNVHAPRYAYLDLESIQGTDRRAVLTSLKNILAEKYGFVFPLFDAGCFAYAQRIGEKVDPVEIKSFIDRNPVLNATLKLADVFVPFLGTGIKLAEIADDMLARIGAFIKGRDKEVKDIKFTQDVNRLYEMLPIFFANDLTKNLCEKQLSEPLVVFFDTYEVLTNAPDINRDSLKVDEWIRGDDGIIQNIPNTLWVMAGREHINWESFDEGWSEALEQHLLGDLSSEDSISFLKGAGVEDENLCNQLYYLTNGTPVYLDLCIDNYLRLKERDIAPQIDMFGKNTSELVALFMRYLDDAQKDLIYFLSCLQRWDDSLCYKTAPEVLGNFSYTTYEKIKEYSFIDKSEDGCYSMHQTVKSVLIKDCPAALKDRTGRHLINAFKPDLEEYRPFDDGFVTALKYTAQAIGIIYKDREELYALYVEHIKPKLLELMEAGRFEQAEAVIDTVCPVKRLINNGEDKMYATVVGDVAYMFVLKGEYNEAVVCAKESCDVLKTLLGEDDVETLRALHKYANYIFKLGRHKMFSKLGDNESNWNLVFTARDIQEKVLAKFQKLLGEDAHDTVKAMNNLANTLGSCGQLDKRLEYAAIVYEKLLLMFGPQHTDTIKALENLAFALFRKNKYDEALENQRKAYNIACGKFGKEHIYTLESLTSLALMMRERPDVNLDEVCTMQEYVLEKRRELLGNNHLATVKAMEILAVTLERMNKRDKAEVLWDEARLIKAEIL